MMTITQQLTAILSTQGKRWADLYEGMPSTTVKRLRKGAPVNTATLQGVADTLGQPVTVTFYPRF